MKKAKLVYGFKIFLTKKELDIWVFWYEDFFKR